MKRVFSRKILMLTPLVLILFSATYFQINQYGTGVGYTFNINSSEVPSDIPDNFNRTDLINFAWQHFIALNWPAKNDYNFYANGGVGGRGEPSTEAGATFANVTSSNLPLLTWHTYAHKTEFINGQPNLTPWDQLGAPSYTYKNVNASNNCDPSSKYNRFNNLDENSQLGLCTVYGGAGTHGNTGGSEILFEAKVNKDNYEYVRQNSLNRYSVYQTNSANTKAALAQYGANTYPCPSDVICFPQGGYQGQEGSVEIKAAWRALTGGEDATKYYTREVIVYHELNDDVCFTNETYALVGLHIIHKTNNLPAYMFATWQHVDNVSGGSYYANNPDHVGDPQFYRDSLDMTGVGPERIPGGSIQVTPTTVHPIADDVRGVTAMVHAALPSTSIWQNYRLTGVQGIPVDIANASSDPDYYLANDVIETNYTLRKYQGNLSQGGIVLSHNNTFYKGGSYNMGGCQGCHGQAQSAKGSDFNFLLKASKKAPLEAETISESDDAATLQARYKELHVD